MQSQLTIRLAGGNAMTQQPIQIQDRRQQTAQTAAQGFRPVALPALVAAVRSVKDAQPRQAGHREHLAILREDALVG
jgi:hypothetical protein